MPYKKIKTGGKLDEANLLALTADNSESQIAIPLGLHWKENSCAYDATLSILFNAWQEDC